MNTRWSSRSAAAMLAFCVFAGAGAHAATNVALISNGAKFIGASSASPHAKNAALTIMQDDVISATRTAWYSNGDKRYTFAPGDEDQWIEIGLGGTYDLTSFGVTFAKNDRPVIGPFLVETSMDGIDWTQAGAAIAGPASSADLLTLAAPVSADYVKYFFGPTSPQYHHGGSAVTEVFAAGAPVPELPAWAAMAFGLGGVGLIARARKRFRAPHAVKTSL